jgi:hypothetical protein
MKGGNRLYFSYAGAAPTAGNCITIAGDIATAVATDLCPQIRDDWSLTEVDVLDIASLTGNSGQWTGSHAGAGSGSQLPASCAMNIEFDISRRYRGGKPRMFLPPPDESALQDAAHWTDAQVASSQTNIVNFFTAVEAISVGAVGALAHINLSYYSGFTNITNSSGRERAVPKYRATALHDAINGYAVKKEIGSQKRRRTATSY